MCHTEQYVVRLRSTACSAREREIFQLAARGLTQAAGADITVAYYASFDRSLRIDGYGTGWGGPRWGGMRSGSAYVGEVLGGTIVVEMTYARTTKIVWRGVARKELDVDARPEKRDKSIGRAVEKLFKAYPVPAEK